MIKKIFRFFVPIVTYEWCVVGSIIGKPCWMVEKCKCRNGTPKKAGGFLYVYMAKDEETAHQICEEFRELAKKIG